MKKSHQRFAALLGERLFELRRGKGLTLMQAARAAGVSRTTVCAVEAGDTDLSLSTFVSLCLALGDEPWVVLKVVAGRP